MSVAEAAQRPAKTGRTVKLLLGFLLVIGSGVALAYAGAGSMQAEVTPSGVSIRTVTAGTGPFVKAMDGVLVEYEGRLTDGTVFDSSEGRGPTPMIPAQTIPGFAEALTKMQKGGRYRVVVPAAQAYGATPPPGGPIPPNADIEFDVHVVQVVPDAGLQVQQQRSN